MKKITKALVALGVGVGLALGGALTATATPVVIDFSPESNQPSWWENYGEHKDASCYKHEADGSGNSANAHGSSNGSTVTLATFNPSWGDHWETLAIKAGTKVAVIAHPSSGVAYSAPEGKDVSHWIICKGVVPDEPEPEPTPEPTPPVEEPEEPTLAETGVDSTLSILGGALMLLSGAGILAYRRFATN